jgi:uncharacterized SAM-binding protein YcdF (DUF218 family)
MMAPCQDQAHKLMPTKKFIAALLLPVSLIDALQHFSLLFRGRLQMPRAASASVAVAAKVAVLLTIVFSLEPIFEAWIGSLERQHQSLGGQRPSERPCEVVVVGGGHSNELALRATSQLDGSALKRLVEGIRLHRMQGPGSRLVLTGGARGDSESTVAVMPRAAKLLGVPGGELILLLSTFSTADEAQIISQLLAGRQLLLVRSAWRMPRAMKLFVRSGAKVTFAPADFLCQAKNEGSPVRYPPSAAALWAIEHAASEYLALSWDWIEADR